ncbi:hypothetical protein BYT27DRAFT_7112696 [Phlegmacium glaucopus]|nr:hypothetical protein BYT27DRAFT_7112696 [Phlegmacium glaucopus]
MADIHIQETSQTVLPRIKPSPKSSKLAGQFFYAPSDDGTDENLLILLHGLGDTHIPFSKLGKSLKLPQTAVLALRAPEQVPFLYEERYQWFTSFDDLGEIIERPNPTPALQYLSKIIDHLINDCAWPIHRIHFFGFAQGGSVAAEFGVDHWKQQQLRAKKSIGSSSSQAGNSGQDSIPLLSFGSIVTVSGPLLSYPTASTLSPTPILVVHRSPPSDTALPPGAFIAFNKAFGSATESKMEAKGVGMPASKQEWDPIMRFWSQHLARRQVQGLYEVMSSGGAN